MIDRLSELLVGPIPWQNVHVGIVEVGLTSLIDHEYKCTVSGVLTQGKDRKIGCDRTLPSCQNCTRRKKACSGYGLRLSWPHEEDRRRSIRTQNVKFEGLTSSKIEFVNATSWDVDLFVELTNTGTYGEVRP